MKENIQKIERIFLESIEVKKKCIDRGSLKSIVNMSNQIVSSIIDGGKILLCGNGGSAADAQHLAAEMIVRLRPMNDREGVAALTLAQDSSTMTACGNDYGFEYVYERVLRSIGKRGDCLLVISTYSNLKNILLAMQAAKSMGIKVFGFLDCQGGAVEFCDEVFIVPSGNVDNIQESHITAGHALMECIEDTLIEGNYLTVK